MKKSLLTYIFFYLSFFTYGQQVDLSPISKTPQDAERTVIVKLKQGVSPHNLSAIIAPQAENNIPEINKAHPQIAEKNFNNRTRRTNPNPSPGYGLDRIYKFRVGEDQDISQVINALHQYDFIEYAEPYYPMELLYIPNDPFADPTSGNQQSLSVIKAYEAWEIEKGDSTMIIGILDTGVNLNHIDLKNNIYLNEADPVNGFDDDGDGYIDNYKGWDFADGDNDPSDVNGHGTQVTGIASAHTDNATGIAGIGFRTKFMPIKVYTSQDHLFNDGYRAILYAAEKGCKVINLSWGSANNYSKYVEDIINTVVLDMDVVVVAAAGNSNLNEEYYPASYENVMSVANVTKADEKADASTFSPYVDIAAPGVDILTTSGSGYANSFGTSMASPTVAGAAALVRAHYPELNALQVIERLRITADDIYGVGNNHLYKEHLGKGRLNMLKALIDTTSCSVRFKEMAYSNALGPYAFYDDTITITGKFVNYLHEASNLKVTLSINSPYAVLIDSVFSTPSLSTLEEKQVSFRVYIKPTAPASKKLRFRLGYSGDDYEDYQYFDINTSADYVTIDNKKLSMTIGSNGNLGYNSDRLNDGVGLNYNLNQNSISLFDFAGLIIGEDPEHVSDNMFNNYNTFTRAKDFKTEKRIKIINDSPSFIEAVSTFSDYSIANSLGIAIKQSLSSYKEEHLNNCLFLDYEITNTGASKDALRIGIFTDWDIIDSMNNRANYDFNYKLAYAYYPEKDIYAGIALLSEQDAVYQAISLYDENSNFIFGSQITDTKKFSLLIKDDNRLETGPTDIASILTAVIRDFKNQTKASIQWAITAGSSLAELQENIIEALLLKRPAIPLAPLTFCKGDDITINPNLGKEVYFYSDSLLTQFIGQGEKITLDTDKENITVFMKRKEGIFYSRYKLDIHIANAPKAHFALSNDSILFDKNSAAFIVMTDESECAERREWVINDSITGYAPEETLMLAQPGTYTLKLKVWDKFNQVDSVSKILHIAYVTGIAEEEIPSLDFFPNPVSTLLNINLPIGKESSVYFTDQIGRIYTEKKIIPTAQPYQLDVSHLNPGLYILKVDTEAGSKTKKVVIH